MLPVLWFLSVLKGLGIGTTGEKYVFSFTYLYFAERNPDTSLSTILISLAGSPVRRDGLILPFSS